MWPKQLYKKGKYNDKQDEWGKEVGRLGHKKAIKIQYNKLGNKDL